MMRKDCVNAMTKLSRTIGFRLDAHCWGLLEARARRCGTSPGDLARTLVVDRLAGNDADELHGVHEQLVRMEAELVAIRRDQADFLESFRTRHRRRQPDALRLDYYSLPPK